MTKRLTPLRQDRWFATTTSDSSTLDQEKEFILTRGQIIMNRLRILAVIGTVIATVYLLQGCGGGGMSKEEEDQFDKEYAALSSKQQPKPVSGIVQTPKVDCVMNPACI